MGSDPIGTSGLTMRCATSQLMSTSLIKLAGVSRINKPR